MRLLLDQNVPLLAARALREMGHEALHAGECGMSLDPDTAYIEKAVGEGWIIATLDADFHAILAKGALTQPSVIRIRIHNPDPRVVSKLIHELCLRFGQDLLNGCVISTDGTSHRVRPLPLSMSDTKRPGVE